VDLIPAATEAGLLDRQIGRCLDLGVTDFSFFWGCGAGGGVSGQIRRLQGPASGRQRRPRSQ